MTQAENTRIGKTAFIDSCYSWLPPSLVEGFGLAGASICFVVMLASKATLNMQTIISSKLCWPQITVLVGSGFSGLFFELSKCSVHSSFVPLGSFMGSVKSYQSCQCQLKRGTFSKVSAFPSAKTIRYCADLPRMCMCGCRPSNVRSSGMV